MTSAFLPCSALTSARQQPASGSLVYLIDDSSGFEFQVLRFGTRDSGFKIRDSRFGIRDSRFEIRDSRFGIWDLGFGIRDSGFWI